MALLLVDCKLVVGHDFSRSPHIMLLISKFQLIIINAPLGIERK